MAFLYASQALKVASASIIMISLKNTEWLSAKLNTRGDVAPKFASLDFCLACSYKCFASFASGASYLRSYSTAVSAMYLLQSPFILSKEHQRVLYSMFLSSACGGMSSTNLSASLDNFTIYFYRTLFSSSTAVFFLLLPTQFAFLDSYSKILTHLRFGPICSLKALSISFYSV